MDDIPRAVAALVREFEKFPGIGPRTARRLVFHLLARPAAGIEDFAARVQEAARSMRLCPSCFTLTADSLCAPCGDPRRDRTVLCVVEQSRDVWSLEAAGGFEGLYFVLGGVISPLEGIGPEDLRLEALETRVKRDALTEIVLALDVDPEGETTARLLADRLAGSSVRVTRLAQGLAPGSRLEYQDPATLGRAMRDRRPF